MSYRNIWKRVIDFTLSLIAFLVLLPIFLLLAIIIKIDSKGPVLFQQSRSGKNNKTFQILKFRTMMMDTPENIPTGQLSDPDRYITGFGNFLRKTSLDELPQIINIIKGEMSIVGPRPLILEETEVISLREKNHANELLPGLTGWAQINGRDVMPPDVKARFDGEYYEKISFWFDAKIFFRSVVYVLRRDGIHEGKIHDFYNEMPTDEGDAQACNQSDDSSFE